MSTGGTPALAEKLVSVFTAIHRTRMRDLPILNERLRVEAVGLRDWQGHWLGVLVTPWSMNLMLLPGEADDWRGLAPGTEHRHRFPAGAYTFIVGEEPGLGRYQMCSLFSPVFEFGDQATAVATAAAALDAILREQNREDLTPRQEAVEQRPTLGERLDEPLSRRQLLRGAFLGDRQA